MSFFKSSIWDNDLHHLLKIISHFHHFIPGHIYIGIHFALCSVLSLLIPCAVCASLTIEFQAITHANTGTAATSTMLGVNNKLSTEGRRRSELDLPEAATSR